MTREEAKESFYCREAGDDGVALVDELYDDFEEQLADYKKRIEELEDAIYAKSKQVDELKAQRMELWMLLDNIDTSEDIAKDSDKLFRNLCRNEYPKRWDIYEPNDMKG